MMPEGLRPIWFRPPTSLRSVVPPRTRSWPPFSLMSVSVRGTTTVLPFEKGAGCDTTGVSVTRTVSVPWVTATVEICTSWPMTIVPVRASMITRASVSGSTRREPISAT